MLDFLQHGLCVSNVSVHGDDDVSHVDVCGFRLNGALFGDASDEEREAVVGVVFRGEAQRPPTLRDFSREDARVPDGEAQGCLLLHGPQHLACVDGPVRGNDVIARTDPEGLRRLLVVTLGETLRRDRSHEDRDLPDRLELQAPSLAQRLPAEGHFELACGFRGLYDGGAMCPRRRAKRRDVLSAALHICRIRRRDDARSIRPIH
mmetsp:Transcript_99920/g.287150  ORF Transcript_99920/g.287150 Transcript_99920/m.287150 type:complete len:205 (+) Transcript_99920:313-927(+)